MFNSSNVSRLTLPNFILVGAARAGSTFLYNTLIQHPDVFLPPRKELQYFSAKLEARQHLAQPFDAVEYARFFAAGAGKKAVGEMSPNYMYTEWSARMIASALSEVKLLFVLRDPVERAYSHYWHNIGRSYKHIRKRKETLSFEQALDREAERLRNGSYEDRLFYSYQDRGFYMPQIARFVERFPREQMRFILFDELQRDPVSVIDELCDFLGIERMALGELPDKHHATIPKYLALHRALTRMRMRAVNAPPPFSKVSRRAARVLKKIIWSLPRTTEYPPMRPETETRLRALFRESNAELAAFLNLDRVLWDES